MNLSDINSHPFKKVTGTLTAAAGDRLFPSMAIGAYTINLPASANIGDEVWFHVVDGLTNTLTIGRNGLNIGNLAEDMTVNADNIQFGMRYFGTNTGWVPG